VEKAMIAQGEWDFSSVLDEELPIAVWWDYLRAIPEIRKAVHSYRLLTKYRDVATALELFAGVGERPFEIYNRIPVPFCQEPEWPRLHFLRLSHDRRRALRGWPNKHETAYELEYDLEELESSVRSEVRDLLRRVPSIGVDHCVDCVNSEQWIPRRIFSEEPPIDVQLALFGIDWTKSNEQLVKMFKTWLHLRRRHDVECTETRGSASAARKYRGLLKQLGAYQLLQRMTWQAAVEHTTAVLQKPLFSQYEHTWQRAAAAAKTNIDSLLGKLTTKYWLPIDHYLVRRELGGLD
jgi:hypothetical protein